MKDFDYEKGIKRILEVILEKNIYLEINTQLSRRKGTNIDTLPSKEIAKEFIGNGGKLISIGSDAHLPEEIGGGVKEILSFLESFNGDKFKLLFG